MEIIAVARSGMDLPLRFTIPYSVTTYIMSARVVVMTLPGGQVENDAARAHAVALVGGGHADERLAALGRVGAADELRLAAGAADVAVARGLARGLTLQVHLRRAVDRNHAVVLHNDVRRVG